MQEQENIEWEVYVKINYVNGQLLNKNQIQIDAKRNKQFNDGEIEERYKLFEKRFIDKEIRNTTSSLPIESFYPTEDFKDVISEITNQLPVNFNIVGKESEFLRKSLIEGSHLKSALSSIYKEGILSTSAFVLMKPKISTGNNELMVLDLEVLPFENCYPEYDVLTGELNKLTYQEDRVYMDMDKSINFLYTVEYTKDSIKTYIRDYSGSRIPNLPDNIIDENPFKEIGVMPVVEFRCTTNKGNKVALASRLVECQLQLDNLNTNIENLINMHSNPIYVVKKTRRVWDGFLIGAGQILTLQDEEDFDIKRSDMQLVALAQRYKMKKDEIYKTGGLVPLSLRDRMYGTDSSKVVKIASSELIGVARILMNNFKKPLITIVQVLLFLNGKTITDEVVSPPEEVLPYDLETVFASMAVGMNLGLVDDSWFWDKYMPELSDNEKERIRENFKSRQESGENVNTDTNVDKKAILKAPTKPMGNKEQASTTSENKDGKILK